MIMAFTHRVFGDMVRMHQSFKVADMWFIVNVPKCNEVCGCPLIFNCIFQLSFSEECDNVQSFIMYILFSNHLLFKFYVLQYLFVKGWTLDQLWLAISKGKKPLCAIEAR